MTSKWKWVPVDATREMIDAAEKVEEDGFDAMHKAMCAVAPHPAIGDDHQQCPACKGDGGVEAYSALFVCPNCKGDGSTPKPAAVSVDERALIREILEAWDGVCETGFDDMLEAPMEKARTLLNQEKTDVE